MIIYYVTIKYFQTRWFWCNIFWFWIKTQKIKIGLRSHLRVLVKDKSQLCECVCCMVFVFSTIHMIKMDWYALREQQFQPFYSPTLILSYWLSYWKSYSCSSLRYLIWTFSKNVSHQQKKSLKSRRKNGISEHVRETKERICSTGRFLFWYKQIWVRISFSPIPAMKKIRAPKRQARRERRSETHIVNCQDN